jgi:hypothetical protein
LAPCAIGGLGANSHLESCPAFQLPAAQAARSTYAYWYLKGPHSIEFTQGTGWLSPFEAGRRQADLLLQQWDTYNAISITHDASTVPPGAPSTDEALHFGEYSIGIDSEAYSQTNDCGLELQPGSSCTIEVHKNTDIGTEARLLIEPTGTRPMQIVPIGNWESASWAVHGREPWSIAT